jgi:antitoxin ChpS
MFTTTLRNVGGSVMMAIPKSLLEGLGLSANTKVGLSLKDGRLVIEPCHKPKYSLTELLEQCDASAPVSAEELAWQEIRPIGDEAW